MAFGPGWKLKDIHPQHRENAAKLLSRALGAGNGITVNPNENCHQGTIAEHQPIPGLPLAHGRTVQATNAPRYRVGIISYACRLRDSDNIFCKHAVDCLREFGIIPDDSPEHITLEVSQVRVKTRAEERTEIEVLESLKILR